jgi:septal ring factor EnvC (AmiA/AmiB activator)
MSELDLIKSKIVDTEAKLKKAEAKLEQLEGSEVKNELEIKKWEGRTERLATLLIAQQNEENLILANQGKKHSFTFIVLRLDLF